MKPTERDMMVARAIATPYLSEADLVALIEALPEPAEHEHQPSSEAPFNPACMQSFDARDWASDFRATAKSLGYCDMDEGWLIGWFANAIMRGFDESERRRDAEHEQAAQDAVIDCGDNSCIFKPSGAGGMRTNGGCRCYERAGFGASAVEAARKMLPEVLRLRREVSVAKREERERVTAIFLDEMQQAHEEQAAHPHAKCINLLEEQHLVNEGLRAEVAAARADGALAERERCARIADDVAHLLGSGTASEIARQIRAAQDEPGGKARDTRKDCTCVESCRGPEGLGELWRCRLGKEQDEPGGKDSTPDPDEVRRALARMRDQSPRLYSFERIVCEAAELWVRDQGGGGVKLDELEKKYPGSPCHDWAPSVSGAYYFCVLQKGHTGPHYADWRTWGTGDPCDELRELIAAED